MWFVKRTDMKSHRMDPCVVHEKNRHAMILVDPCEVSEKNTHFNDNGGSIFGL